MSLFHSQFQLIFYMNSVVLIIVQLKWFDNAPWITNDQRGNGKFSSFLAVFNALNTMPTNGRNQIYRKSCEIVKTGQNNPLFCRRQQNENTDFIPEEKSEQTKLKSENSSWANSGLIAAEREKQRTTPQETHCQRIGIVCIILFMPGA